MESGGKKRRLKGKRMTAVVLQAEWDPGTGMIRPPADEDPPRGVRLFFLMLLLKKANRFPPTYSTATDLVSQLHGLETVDFEYLSSKLKSDVLAH